MLKCCKSMIEVNHAKKLPYDASSYASMQCPSIC